MGSDNKLNFDYTNNSYFEYVKSGNINADYSSYTIGTAENLMVNADYTKSNIEIAEDVEYNCDYGSLTVGKANNVKGNGDYLSLRLGEIYKNVEVKADYGSMKIDKMTSNAGNVWVDSDYMKITIGYDASYDFEFELDLEYAGFKGREGLEITKERTKSNDKYYYGYHGSQNSGNMISISSDYGSVTFKKN